MKANLSAAILARLLNLARQRGDDYTLLLNRFALERLLCRVAASPHADRFLLKGVSEKRILAWDLGFRLGQASEFSLLIAYVAVASALISEQASLLIQATTIITLLVSSYIVVLNYPTPIAISDRLRRD